MADGFPLTNEIHSYPRTGDDYDFFIKITNRLNGTNILCYVYPHHPTVKKFYKIRVLEKKEKEIRVENKADEETRMRISGGWRLHVSLRLGEFGIMYSY